MPETQILIALDEAEYGTACTEQKSFWRSQGDHLTQHKPNFEAAVAEFQELLGKSEYAPKIVWVTPEDIIVTGKGFVYVRVPVPAINEAKARQMYDEGIKGGRGLLMSTACELEDSTCCYIWYPENIEEEPQGIWPKDGGVKMAAKIESGKISGKAIRGLLRWKILALRYRAKQDLRNQLFR